jgi:nucleotide-binding universal stress UspA family protein
MYKHILVPTDGSPLSRAAALAAVKLARSLGARVTGLFAAPAATPVAYRGLLPVGLRTPEENAAMIEKAARRYLDVIESAARAAGVRCECIHVTSDFPADTILKVAAKRKCDLIYMASHGRRGLTGVLIGSETQKVLAGAEISVLVHR